MRPVQFLYHGTSLEYSESIEEQGLVSVDSKVYLTTDILVAYDYALKAIHRPSSESLQPVICVVDAPQMNKDGYIFEHDMSSAEWTIAEVPSRYILQVAVESEEDLSKITQCIKAVIN